MLFKWLLPLVTFKSGIAATAIPAEDMLTAQIKLVSLLSNAVKLKVIVALVWLNKSAGAFNVMGPGLVLSSPTTNTIVEDIILFPSESFASNVKFKC